MKKRFIESLEKASNIVINAIGNSAIGVIEQFPTNKSLAKTVFRARNKENPNFTTSICEMPESLWMSNKKQKFYARIPNKIFEKI